MMIVMIALMIKTDDEDDMMMMLVLKLMIKTDGEDYDEDNKVDDSED